MKGASFFSGNGLYWCAGLLVGTILIGALGWARSHRAIEKPVLPVVVAPVATPAPTPAPVSVQIAAADIRLTAISLGQPSLAVINGRQVTEGDFVTVQTPSAAAPVKLRVLKITDGEVDLGSDAQVIRARLTR